VLSLPAPRVSSEFLAVQGWQVEHDDYQVEGSSSADDGFKPSTLLGQCLLVVQCFSSWFATYGIQIKAVSLLQTTEVQG
jgi:hypothetical protein